MIKKHKKRYRTFLKQLLKKTFKRTKYGRKLVLIKLLPLFMESVLQNFVISFFTLTCVPLEE